MCGEGVGGDEMEEGVCQIAKENPKKSEGSC